MIDKKDFSGIVFSCFSDITRIGEQFYEEHTLSFVLSGMIERFDGITKHYFHKGNINLFKKNSLAKFIKYPADGEPYRAISVRLDQKCLKDFNSQYYPDFRVQENTAQSIFPICSNKLLENYLESLQPWFTEKMPDELVELKKQEVLLLILKDQPQLKDILFDYQQPGKIDLQAYMNQNFKFNLELNNLAYLTGRSLATFKRDFARIFNMSPHRWILAKRLQEAYYLLSEKKGTPNHIYVELGFDSLSHFSYAFKKHFGRNPSTVYK
jgi:AraC-like DNA-binding protein